jgi:Protein of unknown function (DUF3800)
MQLSSIRLAMAGLRHDYFGRVHVHTLKAFIDDSGSGGDSPWFVLAGYVGTAEAWDAFDEPWRKVLNGPPKLDYFKHSEVYGFDTQWAPLSKSERHERLDSFIKVIGAHATRSIYVRLKQQDYDEVIKPFIPLQWQNPYYFLFIGFLSAATMTAKYLRDGDSVEFFFDGNQEVEKPSRKLYGQAADLSQFRQRVENIFYKDEKQFLPLQAADLLAWEVRRRFSVEEEPRPQFERAINCPSGPPFNHTVTRAELEKMGRDMDDQAMMDWALAGYPEHLRKWKRPR